MAEPRKPTVVELQAHAITKAMESVQKIMVEDFWQRDGRAWLKYWPPGGPMWVLTIEPFSWDGTAEQEIERLRAEVAALRAEVPLEWGCRWTLEGGGRHDIASRDEATARRAVASMRDDKPAWDARLIARDAARKAGDWHEVPLQDSEGEQAATEAGG